MIKTGNYFVKKWSVLRFNSTSLVRSKTIHEHTLGRKLSSFKSLSTSTTNSSAIPTASTKSKSDSIEKIKLETLLEFDKNHIWHPYTSLTNPLPVYPVASAKRNKLILEDGGSLIDGMSSWWCAIHGYNHPKLNEAIQTQISKMSHVMFGGITHRPAMELCYKLVEMTPDSLNKVFLCDSGSVSVEVAIKMAIQYHMARGEPDKSKLISIRKGYHGDTFGAMSVCDPETGMHHIFKNMLTPQIFIPPPMSKYSSSDLLEEDKKAIDDVFEKHHAEAAAFILEPIVQGAGGMRIYSPEYLHYVRQKCDEYNVLLIADEIATGFGRTGTLFGCNHPSLSSRGAGIQPDIMCLGKALTGGTMTMAATLCTEKVANTICNGEPGVFMHGPTFMGNPLACSVALASIELLEEMGWEQSVQNIEKVLSRHLLPLSNHGEVADVRVLGAIGVVECHDRVNVPAIQKFFVDRGVWIRPFNKTIYIMPPFISGEDDLIALCRTIADSLDHAFLFHRD